MGALVVVDVELDRIVGCGARDLGEGGKLVCCQEVGKEEKWTLKLENEDKKF